MYLLQFLSHRFKIVTSIFYLLWHYGVSLFKWSIYFLIFFFFEFFEFWILKFVEMYLFLQFSLEIFQVL